MAKKTTATEGPAKLNFPRLHKLTLRRFSLYSREPVVEEALADGVFCLAGANGLGKSTFLSAANFAITGLVSDPGRKFESVEENYKKSLDFAREYFQGRITDKDREAAEVSIELTVGEHLYLLTRGMFDTEELRSLTIYQSTTRKEILVDGIDLSATERHDQYTEQLVKDVGLATFEQFVFLQHFLLTFDERRHLMFWNPRVLEQTLYLAFGVDHNQAKRADTLRRESERADSLARNANWQATEVRKKLKDLEETAAATSGTTDTSADLVAEHQAMGHALTESETTIARLEAQQRDASLHLAALSAEQVSLKTQYAEEFARRLQSEAHVAHHPLVVASMADATCGLCGAKNEQIRDRIQARCHAADCPLCGSTVGKEKARSKDVTQLRALDTAIADNKGKLDLVVKSLTRLAAELVTAQQTHERTETALKGFESENYSILTRLKAAQTGTGSLDAVLAAYRRQLADFEKEKKLQYKKRDERRAELKILRTQLEVRYAAAEGQFLPLFKNLAFQFLGLDLDIRIESQTVPGTTLVLDMKNAPRREFHQMSESQRFFVDIALRMALAEFMSAPNGKATLYIDTPEGSLDIAYENRAGNMLASFVDDGYHIIMTANINSSRLLHSLAKRLGRKKMQLCRMTSWAELSDVQSEQEAEFEDAYAVIEDSLKAARKR